MRSTKPIIRSGPVVPIPLVPEDGLYLWDWGRLDLTKTGLAITSARITNKFIRGFKTVWSRIPDMDRDTLTGYWRSKRPLNPEVKPCPAIEFNSFCLPKTFRASCGRGGLELLFDIWYLEFATPTSIVHTIAHELGHAISHPHGWYKQHECTSHSDECIACECRAFSYMASWGFDPFHDLLPKQKRQQFLVDRFRNPNHDAAILT